MIIRSQEYSYEVIQALPGEGKIQHYLCKNSENGEEQLHLICMGPCEEVKDFLPVLSELDANASFVDLKEYFLEKEKIWMVFPWTEGRDLEKYLEEGHSAAERFNMGRELMERMILLAMPPWLIRQVSQTKRITVAEDGMPGFYYTFGAWRSFDKISAAQTMEALAELLHILLKTEEDSGLYPEWNSWQESLKSEDKPELLDLYKKYLDLMPIFSQERKKEEKAGFRERIKAALPRIMTILKIIMGLAVIVAAVTVSVGVWRQNVSPVIDAASMWKAVYVDGETMEPESESTSEEEKTEEETETELDPDNGRGERYREDGSLSYRGGLKDGLFDDTGTLYYPDGTIAYQGDFLFGKKDGEGSFYTDGGILYYEGEFKKDRFEGKGRLYDPDTGSLVYEGEFEGNRYCGEGVLYNPETEFPRYVGSFRLGKYDGKGLEYDTSGNMLYEGEFLLGVHHGQGTFYDPSTGAVLMEGLFRNDIFVGPAEETQEGERSGETGEDTNPAKEAEAPSPENMDGDGTMTGENAGTQMGEAENNSGSPETEEPPVEIGPGVEKHGIGQ